MPHVRPLDLSDIEDYYHHLLRAGRESGRDGDLIFTPHEDPWNKPYDTFLKEKTERWSRTLLEVGWERSFALIDGDQIFGELRFIHEPAIKTTLHRATIAMVIERTHRGQGWGPKLMTTALDWARAQPSLDWAHLFVFEHNEPARKLYRKFGFKEVGMTMDYFRIHGQSLNDIAMTLKLRE